jgi:hypothetical protein
MILGSMGRISLIVLIGLSLIGLSERNVTVASQADGAKPRRGQVRVEGHAVVDADGPFNALGATMFWGAWGYKHDRARLDRNLEALSRAGVDYIRVLGSVGGNSWADRLTDPGWPDYETVIAGLTDRAYDRYGLRVQWTLFGGAPFTPSGPARERLVDRFAAMAKGREHKIFAFEIANEGWSNGFRGPDGLAELRALGKRMSDKTPVLVALTAPSDSVQGAYCATYAGAGVDVATVHYERGFGSEGPVRPLKRMWGYPAAFDAQCVGQLPKAVFNNEPIGPESSVRQDDNPVRIAAGFVLTFLAKNAAYVFHSGPGIRGGGAADVAGSLRRHSNFDELPSFKSISTALKAAKGYLPAGLANWERHRAGDERAPLEGFDQTYAATSGRDFIALLIDIRQPVTVRPRVASSIEVRDLSTGKILQQVQASAAQALTLSGHEALILTGRAATSTRD